MQVEISEDGFIATIRSLEGGALIEELDRAVMKCVQAIKDRGGASSLTLRVHIKRIPGMATAVAVSADEVAVKVPKEERLSKVLFTTNGCGLTDQNQEQESLDLGAPIHSPQKPELKPVPKIGDSNV